MKYETKLEKFMKRLRKAKDDLLGLLSEPSLDAFIRALLTCVLTSANSPEDPQQTRKVSGTEDNLVCQGAQ